MPYSVIAEVATEAYTVFSSVLILASKIHCKLTPEVLMKVMKNSSQNMIALL